MLWSAALVGPAGDVDLCRASRVAWRPGLYEGVRPPATCKVGRHPAFFRIPARGKKKKNGWSGRRANTPSWQRQLNTRMKKNANTSPKPRIMFKPERPAVACQPWPRPRHAPARSETLIGGPPLRELIRIRSESPPIVSEALSADSDPA